MDQDPAWNPSTDLDFRDLPVFDLVEEQHQPDHLGTEYKIRESGFRARFVFGIKFHISQNQRRRISQNWFPAPDRQVLDGTVIR